MFSVVAHLFLSNFTCFSEPNYKLNDKNRGYLQVETTFRTWDLFLSPHQKFGRGFWLLVFFSHRERLCPWDRRSCEHLWTLSRCGLSWRPQGFSQQTGRRPCGKILVLICTICLSRRGAAQRRFHCWHGWRTLQGCLVGLPLRVPTGQLSRLSGQAGKLPKSPSPRAVCMNLEHTYALSEWLLCAFLFRRKMKRVPSALSYCSRWRRL